MKKCPCCFASNFEPNSQCARCGNTREDILADQPEGDLFTKRTKRIWMIIAFTLVVIVFGINLWPYIMWSLAGPMHSLG